MAVCCDGINGSLSSSKCLIRCIQASSISPQTIINSQTRGLPQLPNSISSVHVDQEIKCHSNMSWHHYPKRGHVSEARPFISPWGLTCFAAPRNIGVTPGDTNVIAPPPFRKW
ncbi:Sterol 3-beta-glucosyltransferase [Fusarium oxysporum f. sp. albedinis]|nr:Sterol 3-beta-glucosyltransferase [Fusarium oxysporum f. sp. albedinis]